MTGDLGSSFNHLSAVCCHFLVKALLSALGKLKPVTAALQQVNKGETFMSFLGKQLTALLPREDQNPSYKWLFLHVFSWDEAANDNLANSKYSLYFSTSLQVEVKVFASWCLSQLSVNSKAVSSGSLFTRNSWNERYSFYERKQQPTISHNLLSSLPILTTERSRDFIRIEWSPWAPPPYHKGRLSMSRMRKVQCNKTCSILTTIPLLER